MFHCIVQPYQADKDTVCSLTTFYRRWWSHRIRILLWFIWKFAITVAVNLGGAIQRFFEGRKTVLPHNFNLHYQSLQTLFYHAKQ